jgi:uncharacterized membrane protein YhfC
MVSPFSIIAMIFSALLALMFPLILGFFLRRKYNYVSLAFVVGGLSFFVLQVLIRMPLLQNRVVIDSLSKLPTIVYFIVLAFTAGLFETVGRILSIKYLMKKNRDFNTGLAHGIGHGGIEAIVLVTLTYVNYVVYAFMINNGFFQALIDSNLGGAQEQLIMIREVLIYTDSYIFIMAGIERVMAIILHIGLSVLVMYGICSKKKSYFLIVLGIHFLVDFIVIMIAHYLDSLIWAELFMLLVAIGIFYLVKIYKKKFASLTT